MAIFFTFHPNVCLRDFHEPNNTPPLDYPDINGRKDSYGSNIHQYIDDQTHLFNN